jgi:hypothetical protein
MKSNNPSGSQKSSKTGETAPVRFLPTLILAAGVALATVIAYVPSLRDELVNCRFRHSDPCPDNVGRYEPAARAKLGGIPKLSGYM